MTIFSKALDKYKNSNQVGKAAIWFTISNLLLKGISLITVPLFTRLLPPDEYGILSIYLSYEQLVLVFSNWDVSAGAYQKGLFTYKDDEDFFTCVTQFFANMMTVGFFLIVFICKKLILEFTGIPLAIVVLMFGYMLTYVGYKNWLILKQKNYDYKHAIIATLTFSLINVFVPLFAVLNVNNTANVKYVTGAGASLFFFLPFYVRQLKYHQFFRYKSKFFEQLRYILKFQAPYVVYTISLIILAQADRIMIGKMVGNAEAAYYSIAYNLAYVMIIFQSSVDQVLIPWKYQKMEDGDYKSIKLISNCMVTIIAGLILSFIIVAPEIMKVLFTDSYLEAVWSIPPIATSIFFIYLGSVYVNIESYFEKTEYIMYISVICSVLNILLNIVCINVFGYIACGYTTLISYIVFAIGHYYFMRKICKEKLSGVAIFNNNYFVAISLVTIMVAVIMTFLYKYIVYRYIVLTAIALLIVVYRKKLLNVFKMIGGENND